MAGVLESLASGLRGAGGVLSPDAFKVLAAEDQQNDQLRRQIELFKIQQQMADIREKALATSVAPFLEKGDLTGAAAAATRSGAPGATKLALELTSKAEERKSREQIQRDALEQRGLQMVMMLDQRQAALDQTKELALQRASDARERDAINQRFREAQLALQTQNAELNARFKQQGLDLQQLRLDQMKDKQIGTGTQKLSAALEKANLPEADAVLGTVEKALDKTPALAEYLSGPKSLIPDVAVPNDIAAGRQAFQKLFNITLKNRSGAAVTIPEFERLKAEFGNGTFKTPAQLRNAVEQARNIISKHYASVAAGFEPEVLNAYNENIRQFGGRVVLEPQQSGKEDPLGIR